ncbi:MAG: hypothetical protein ACREF3_01640 [Acetobacteraceae bacterium]
MAIELASERRLLTESEYQRVEQSHYPTLGTLPHDETLTLARWLREQHARLRDIIRDRRRARRGKAAGAGLAAPETSERGLAAKKQVFAHAIRRVNGRLERFRAEARRARVTEGMQTALRRKRAARVHHPSAGFTPGRGMRPIDSTRGTVRVDPREIGRVSQFVRDAQARRDA